MIRTVITTDYIYHFKANAFIIVVLKLSRGDKRQCYTYFVINLAIADFFHLISILDGLTSHFIPFTEVKSGH